jgi:anti-sigma regulatory factor (Ser/Thr protein kinase)
MQRVTGAQISVGKFFDCGMAQQTALEIAQKLGFAAQPSEEIVLVVTELASHLATHSGSGVLTLRMLDDDGKIGIEVEAEDHLRAMRDL